MDTPISDADLAAICAALDGLPETSERPYRGMIARIRHLEAQLAALQARALPEPRRVETIEEIDDLPDGAYWVALDRMRDTSLPWCLLLRIYGAWVWHGDDIHEADSDLIGAWIVGPLPLPTTPIGETDND